MDVRHNLEVAKVPGSSLGARDERGRDQRLERERPDLKSAVNRVCSLESSVQGQISRPLSRTGCIRLPTTSSGQKQNLGKQHGEASALAS